MRRSLTLIAAALLTLTLSARADQLSGAGSTFAYPIIWKWAQAYSEVDGTLVDYQSVGSSTGVNRIREKAVDFGASDKPLKPEELDRLGLGQFPIVFGGVVPVVNIAGIAPGTMRFTGAVLADIYMGKITRWSDPALKALNPDLALPDSLIAVIHRSDGSGTTFNWVSYLSKASAEWKRTLGEGNSVAWPVGSGERGNEGVSLAVQRTANAIGYVEFTYVTQAKLSYGLVQNRAGHFIAPSAASFQTAALAVDWTKTRDFYATINDSEAPEAYPIAATTFILMYRKPADAARNRAALSFFDFALGAGSEYASQLGYVPLPEPLVQQVKNYWAATFKSGS
ncbi:phosphate ABC transporter substrate-binding protein PstS [Ancylobacter dichloromethanicus]|uniref:Phosphate-binding protein PstS n=1 Tax=Ancylobacter dichloromethanicus TaxID=518825 RepID=A0A9W6J9R5_9HYPH|nr:phosphate ABC transporter substrate-binding protein PstS [Ancylobacter dichloromethanicus]MBS7556664.1 phosphate ABC transporter substrate-binding protein PstS [Ancylobacter dichloromethanicus]GLK73515.1 phosphate-binding protein PstS [Ancylobacter dichloromethanicus]